MIPEPLSILNSTCPGAWERSRSQPWSDNIKIQTGSGQPVGPLSRPLRVRFQTQPAQGLGMVTFKTESRQHKNKRFQAVRVESFKFQFCVGPHILFVFFGVQRAVEGGAKATLVLGCLGADGECRHSCQSFAWRMLSRSSAIPVGRVFFVFSHQLWGSRGLCQGRYSRGHWWGISEEAYK